MTHVVDPPEVREGPPVDPRLRARRIEVRREEGRRRLRRLVVLAVVTLVCLVAWGLSRSPLLDLDHLEVEGAERLSADAVIAATGFERGDALLDLDLGGATDRLAALPWVEQVTVDRSWRGTVRIQVVERRPVAVARAGAEGPALLVDADGQVLDTATAADLDRLPLVVGLEVGEPGSRLDGLDLVAVAVADRAGEGLLGWVDHIARDDAGLWLELREDAVVSAGGSPGHPGRVQLGDGRELADQLLAAETVLARVELSCLAEIDVRVPSSPVVRRAEDCDGTGAPA
jgi:hypothetical protein